MIVAARRTRIVIHNETREQVVVSSASLATGSWSPGARPAAGDLVGETYECAAEHAGGMGIAGGSIALAAAGTTLIFTWAHPGRGDASGTLTHLPPGFDAAITAATAGPDAILELALRPSALLDTGFRPSVHGWRFSNSAWPKRVANAQIPLPFGLKVGIGDASDGMCGGMAYAAIDYFLAGEPIPRRATAPQSLADPDFALISRRLYDSFHLADVLGNSALHRYLGYMAAPAQRQAQVMAHEAVPAVRARIAAGEPAALGVICARSANVLGGVAKLGRNHQVVAYDYRRDGPRITLGVYDPNLPGRDDVSITVDADTGAITHNISISPVHMFFDSGYAAPESPRA